MSHPNAHRAMSVLPTDAIDATWLAQFDAHTLLAVGELLLIAFVPIAVITVGAGILARLARLSWGQTAVVCLLPVGILEAAILSFSKNPPNGEGFKALKP